MDLRFQFLFWSTCAILGTWSAAVTSDEAQVGYDGTTPHFHQQRQINFFKWFFGGGGDDSQDIRRNGSTATATNTSGKDGRLPSLVIATNSSNGNGTLIHPNKPSIPNPLPPSFHDMPGSIIVSHFVRDQEKNSTNGSRVGKQMFPGGPGGYFPYPVFALPFHPLQSPAFMNLPNFQNQKRRQRPIYNVYTEDEEDGVNSFEMEENKDIFYQEEEPMDVDDGMLNRLRIPLRASQVDRISIEVDPTSESTSDEETKNGYIEDYDTSRDDDAGEEVELKQDEIKGGTGRNRKVRTVSQPLSQGNSHCDGIDCLHSSIFDRRRPASRGRIEGVDTARQGNFSNVPVLSAPNVSSPSSQNSMLAPNGTIPTLILASNSIIITNTTTATLPTTTTEHPPGSSAMGSGASTSRPLLGDGNITDDTHGNHFSTSSLITPNSTSIPTVNNGTLTTNTPQYPVSTQSTESTMSMSSVASSFTPSQSPIAATTDTSVSSSTPVGEPPLSNASSSTNSTEGSTAIKPLLPTMSAILNCQCGIQSISTEKTGSTLIRIMTHPWLVQISSKNKHLCSGSILNDRYIITAASCIDMYEKRNLRIISGLQLRNPTVFSVTKVAIHPKYDPTTFSNNLALLRLSERAKPSRLMRPICLPLGQSKFPHHTAHLITWLQRTHNGGRVKGMKTRNPQLLQTEVELLNSTTCQSRVTAAVEGVQISNGTLCTSPPAQQKCGGDIGGVLQAYAGKFSYEQLGIVSLSVGCRANELPGIYTDVRHYLRWILFQTQDAHYCREPNGGSFSE